MTNATPPLLQRLNWPRPLWLHLSNVWSCLSSAPSAWMSSNVTPLGPPPWLDPQAQKNLQNLQPQNAAAHAEIGRLIAADAAKQWQDFLRGLWLYQHHATLRSNMDWEIVATHQAVALKRLSAQGKAHGAPVLLIPSLINSFHILDLCPTQSFARYLQGCGYDVYLLDWHHDAAQTLTQSIADCINHHIHPAVMSVPKKPHVIGYCMGGTLSVLAALQDAKAIRSLTLMATPWDFSNGMWTHFGQTLQQMEQATPLDHVTAEWLQILFWQRDSLASLRKFRQFAQMPQNDHAADLFVLAEDWLNSGIDLPASLLNECAEQWFAQNRPAQTASLQPLRTLPVHIVTATRDQLVPRDSSHALSLPKAIISEFDTGHIGLFAGSKSRPLIWPHVQQFLASHNS
jgi:polyhydroxyalkanoate synthase